MEDWRLGTMEMRFAEIIWQNAPISSGELVKLCEKELSWKKSTTYTMLRRLCEKKIFENKDSTVEIRITKEELLGLQSKTFVKETFGGSLPKFIAAFTGSQKLSEKDIEELKALIEKNGGK